jgi:glycyl-tRNA synthetase
VPFVIETSVGADRVTLASLVNAYREEEVPGEQEGRVVLGLHPAIAPLKAACSRS